jgi:hypothetical protein
MVAASAAMSGLLFVAEAEGFEPAAVLLQQPRSVAC